MPPLLEIKPRHMIEVLRIVQRTDDAEVRQVLQDLLTDRLTEQLAMSDP